MSSSSCCWCWCCRAMWLLRQVSILDSLRWLLVLSWAKEAESANFPIIAIIWGSCITSATNVRNLQAQRKYGWGSWRVVGGGCGLLTEEQETKLTGCACTDSNFSHPQALRLTHQCNLPIWVDMARRTDTEVPGQRISKEHNLCFFIRRSRSPLWIVCNGGCSLTIRR